MTVLEIFQVCIQITNHVLSHITIGFVSQVSIIIISFTSAWLSQDHRYSRQKYACILALLGQPFWMYNTYIAEQWGMFTACFFFTAAWLKGVYNYWIKK